MTELPPMPSFDVFIELASLALAAQHCLFSLTRDTGRACMPQGEDLTTFGELLAEDTFRVPRAKMPRQVFLFEKMVLITKKRDDGTLVYKTHILVSWRRLSACGERRGAGENGAI